MFLHSCHREFFASGISNGQVIFNVSDDLIEDLYEVIEAEDADIEKGKLQSAIQRIGTVLLWLPNKALNRYWARKHVIILPSWAFNKLILGNIKIWYSIDCRGTFSPYTMLVK